MAFSRAHRRLARRVSQLYIGLVIYGVAAALMVRSRLGLDPWDVFHQGIAQHLGLEIGTVVILVGALTFFPALSLGPIVEHFLMHQGRLWSYPWRPQP